MNKAPGHFGRKVAAAAKQSKAKQGKANQSKARQSKAKQSKGCLTKWREFVLF